MPTLMGRGLPNDLVRRVREYARHAQITTSEAIGKLLQIALDNLDARAAGGKARMQGLSPEERSDQARSAAQARWDKEPSE
jgi:hypothetical protein